MIGRTRILRGSSLLALAACVWLSVPAVAQATTRVFSSMGVQQTFTVPVGVTSVHVVAIGGQGGSVGGSGGFGAQATADLSVSPGEVLYVEVGGNGAGSTNQETGGAGGFNGGGDGGTEHSLSASPGNGGGGASDVRTVSRSQAGTLDSRVIVAGGGGGGSGFGGDGGAAGQAGSGAAGGGAGTSSAGGAAGGAAGAGTLGTGGAGEDDFTGGIAGGGGGGGLYGGGGGGRGDVNGSGGGGGSSGFGAGTSNTSVGTESSGTPSITFTYTIPSYALTVRKAGAGAGTVTSSPAGISCGGTCAHSFTAGTAVTLTARPASGSQFAGWSGACSGTGTCKVTMNAARPATATFKKLIPPPNTRITGEFVVTGKRKATFDFTGSGGVGRLHFQCKLDAGRWSTCASPKTYTGLARKRHTFQVRAIDSRGKMDQTPDKRTFSI